MSERDGGAVYRHGKDIVLRKVAGQVLLVPIRGTIAEMEELFVLEGVGGVVWDMLDGRHTLDEVIDGVANAHEVARDQAVTDVAEFIGTLVAAGLIEEVARDDGVS